MGSELYKRTMKWADKEGDRGHLMHKVWDRTPWMIEAFTGNISNGGRYREIMDWCREHFGPESWPIHGKPGNWHSGGATIHGWTWMGFATEEMLNEFSAKWSGVETESN